MYSGSGVLRVSYFDNCMSSEMGTRRGESTILGRELKGRQMGPGGEQSMYLLITTTMCGLHFRRGHYRAGCP